MGLKEDLDKLAKSLDQMWEMPFNPPEFSVPMDFLVYEDYEPDTHETRLARWKSLMTPDDAEPGFYPENRENAL